jgi:hypothetical protein
VVRMLTQFFKYEKDRSRTTRFYVASHITASFYNLYCCSSIINMCCIRVCREREQVRTEEKEGERGLDS